MDVSAGMGIDGVKMCISDRVVDIEARGTRFQRSEARDGSLDDGGHERRAEGHNQNARHDGQPSGVHGWAEAVSYTHLAVPCFYRWSEPAGLLHNGRDPSHKWSW